MWNCLTKELAPPPQLQRSSRVPEVLTFDPVLTQVEELVREMARVLSRELTERHRAESQLLMLPLQVTRQ